jgi:STAS domain
MTVTLTARFHPPRARLRLAGVFEVDDHELGRRLEDVMQLGCDIEVDARAVSAIDDQSLGALALARQRLRRNGCELSVVAPSLPFRRAARWAGLPSLLDGPAGATPAQGDCSPVSALEIGGRQ